MTILKHITLDLNAMTDGMWLDLQIQPRNFDHEEARRTIGFFLRQLFPSAFDTGDDSTAPQTATRSS